jgi:hypothetical protein
LVRLCIEEASCIISITEAFAAAGVHKNSRPTSDEKPAPIWMNIGLACIAKRKHGTQPFTLLVLPTPLFAASCPPRHLHPCVIFGEVPIIAAPISAEAWVVK